MQHGELARAAFGRALDDSGEGVLFHVSGGQRRPGGRRWPHSDGRRIQPQLQVLRRQQAGLLHPPQRHDDAKGLVLPLNFRGAWGEIGPEQVEDGCRPNAFGRDFALSPAITC